ncbi:hypothetical protein HU200_057034 [Digitaria exilis]|uniref:Uncharacterized protein n=1 Tax=Digitaria exilis TaxID=1010633 RepID=A0A835E0C1_9POAL|nr:hypothetical protein HU200_057034 [Digitaria exilis]
MKTRSCTAATGESGTSFRTSHTTPLKVLGATSRSREKQTSRHTGWPHKQNN